MASIDPSALISDIEAQIKSNSNFFYNLEHLKAYLEAFEKANKSPVAAFYTTKAILHLLQGEFVEVISLKGVLTVKTF